MGDKFGQDVLDVRATHGKDLPMRLWIYAFAGSLGAQRVQFRLPLPGSFLAMNGLSVLAAARELGIEPGAAARARGGGARTAPPP